MRPRRKGDQTMQRGFVWLDEAVPGILWDAKYATSDNFTGAPVDGYNVNRTAGTLELAAALACGLISLYALALTCSSSASQISGFSLR